jgi:putative membrane protein insertion efficiency factor
MATISGNLKKGLIATIKLYQLGMSGFFGHCCRFEPTCSAYALEAINKYGCVKGCWLSIRRLFSCHPWHRGGIDPVPQSKHKT